MLVDPGNPGRATQTGESSVGVWLDTYQSSGGLTTVQNDRRRETRTNLHNPLRLMLADHDGQRVSICNWKPVVLFVVSPRAGPSLRELDGRVFEQGHMEEVQLLVGL